MGSAEVITQMVMDLLLESQDETALMFVEKLGLGEILVNHIYDKIKIDAAKDAIKDCIEITSNFKQFQEEIHQSLLNLN